MPGMINCRPLAQELLRKAQRKLGGTPRKVVMVAVGEGETLRRYGFPHKHASAVAAQLGIQWTPLHLPATVGLQRVVETITALNENPCVHGIVLHRPFPAPISLHTLHQTVRLDKDVEGMHPATLGKLVFKGSRGMLGQSGLQFEPCTAKAAIETAQFALAQAGIESMQGLEVLVVGHSSILARPVCSYLHAAGATVTICTNNIPNIAAYTRAADVIFTSINAGENTLDAAMIKPGALVIDIGINYKRRRRKVQRTREAHVLEQTGDVGEWQVVGDAQLSSILPIARIATLSSGMGIVRTAILMNNIANTRAR